MAQLIEVDGKVAVSFGWMTNFDKPERNHLYYVGKAKAEDYKCILGCHVEVSGSSCLAYYEGRYFRCELDNKGEWKQVTDIEPVKKPRKGKDYDWEWSMGKWRKVWI
jgi:hypothetical protein